MADNNLVIPFLGALQAAVSVLLTILVGVVAAQFGLLSEKASKDVSQICVKLLLPALLIYNVGNEMNLQNALRYVPIIIWAIVYNATSIIFGLSVTRIFNLPDWVTPAITFNNTTALPLLLIESLDAAGILDEIDPFGGAVSRAKSYLLINAMVADSLTFGLGPKLLNGQNQDAPDEKPKENGHEDVDDVTVREVESQEADAEHVNEETSLLPNGLTRPVTRGEFAVYKQLRRVWARLPSWLQKSLGFTMSLVNPPFIGACIGVVIGIMPALHRLFFNTPDEGGYFNAWLTTSIKNVGSLFAALQVIVVGVKLATSLLRMRKGEASGKVPWGSATMILVIRYLIWPAISIPVIYLIASKTSLLSDDPLLWFCMMLMPTGPPAFKLATLADCNGAEEEEKMAIAKFLALSYAVSPVICLAVVGSLKACTQVASA